MSFYCLSDGKTIFLFYFILWLFYEEQYGIIWALKALTKIYLGGVSWKYRQHNQAGSDRGAVSLIKSGENPELFCCVKYVRGNILSQQYNSLYRAETHL